MQVGVGNAWRGTAALVALAVGGLTGCAGEDEGAGGGPRASASASTSAALAGRGGPQVKSGGTIGATGSACELPVTLDVAEGWQAEAVGGPPGATGGESAAELSDALLSQGPVTLVCEVDAKPAGHIGFLRIWTGEAGDADPRGVLEEFVAAESGVSEEEYSAFESGGVEGVEVAYLRTSEVLEETKQERALAVSTPGGPVVVHLGGLDTQEHEAMLPAYELAKRSLATGTA
ncbi:lipoprotein [Streptomyces sp. HMX87]|uniref:lipoprotein n=1 Tax=Streptomyces sp. HMX87 TaxID=3390849 RepID=UPI003A835804